LKTLFEAERTTLVESLQMTADSLSVHGSQHRHWCVAFSGGKDSSATLTAVLHLIETGRVPRPKSMTVLYADTRLELPNLQASAVAMLEEVRRRGWQTRTVLPALDKRFFVMIFGRGVPPSHSGFRWCTGAIKIDPMQAAMREIHEEVGEQLLQIVGLRIGESANRDKRIALACSSKNGGECGTGWFEEATPAEVAHSLSPLLHWRTCHVWDWLMLERRRHGFDTSMVAEVYDQDAEGSALEVLARTGCLVCPVASKDLALERTLAKPEWAYLAPLARLRTVYHELSQAKNRLRKNGERKADGSLSSRPMRSGPLLMEARAWGLAKVLTVQADVNRAAERLGRQAVDLISGDELRRILELQEANTWPQGWTGDEPAGDELLAEIFPDGTVQPTLFGN
jgi:DNA sulfur modification protein DndC